MTETTQVRNYPLCSLYIIIWAFVNIFVYLINQMYNDQFADYSVCLKFRHAADIGNNIAIVVYKVF